MVQDFRDLGGEADTSSASQLYLAQATQWSLLIVPAPSLLSHMGVKDLQSAEWRHLHAQQLQYNITKHSSTAV